MSQFNEFADCRARSQAGQELFVLRAMNWKRRGTYLEFGANDPIRHNNTWLLSQEFGWKGLSVELDTQYAPRWVARRPGDKIKFMDALEFEYTGGEEFIDYLSIDLDPPAASLALLNRALTWGVTFSTITFEHDAWRGDTFVREESRRLLMAAGYHLAVPDVRVRVEWPDMGPEPLPFEDWWIDPDMIDPATMRAR